MFFFSKLILDSEEGREREMWKQNINQLPPTQAQTRDQTCNPGMCPDLESNPQPFGIRDVNPTN